MYLLRYKGEKILLFPVLFQNFRIKVGSVSEMSFQIRSELNKYLYLKSGI